MKKNKKSVIVDRCLFLAPAIFVLLYNLTIFNRYFPLSEGWWETYGYLINQGLIPYKDFNLAFPPLVPLVSAFLLKYVSGDFFTLRLIGAFLFSLIPLIFQCVLEFFLVDELLQLLC